MADLLPPIHFLLCNESRYVRPDELYRVSAPFERYLGLVNRVWMPHRSPPVVSTIERRSKRPRGTKLMLFVDGKTDNGVLAQHYDLDMTTVGRVFGDQGTGLNSGRHSLYESLCHEGAEILGNPDLNRWYEVPGSGGAETPGECVDALQTTFAQEHRGFIWKAANFCHPAYFGLPNPPGVEGLDHAGELTEPFQLTREGYRVMWRSGDTWIETGNGTRQKLEDLGAAWQHPLSRTRHLVTSARIVGGT